MFKLRKALAVGFLISVINTKRSNATSTSKSGARGAVPAKENGRRATDNRLSTQSSQMAKKKLNKSPPKNMEEVVKRVYKHVAPSGGLPNPSSAAELPPQTQTTSADQEFHRKPLVAIVGRPNVGKSTLFNRLLGFSKSIITDTAGTTRDRKYGICEWEDYAILMVDTGGMLGDSGDLSENIHRQALLAIEEADFIIFMGDVTQGIEASERTIARVLRQSQKPVLMVVNKCDNESRGADASQFGRLGFGEPVCVSAMHNIGTVELFLQLAEMFKKGGFKPTLAAQDEEADKMLKICIVGVPNVGKSSFLNKVVGAERSIVSPIPGTTTDPVDEEMMWNGKVPITLIDTAGVRRKRAQEVGIEKLSALWSLKVIERSTVSLLLLDARQGPGEQDIKLANYIIDNYKSCIVVINKWDTAYNRTEMGQKEYEEHIRDTLKFHYYVPVLFSSAKTGYNVTNVIEAAIKVAEERKVKISTNRLFQIIDQSTLLQPPPSKGNVKVKIRYVTQTSIAGGPSFIFFVNRPDLVPDVYTRFLETCLRREYPFTGTPLRLVVKKNENTQAEKNSRR